MEILLYHPDGDVNSMVSFCLEAKSGITIHKAANFQDAMDLFLSDTPIGLLITSEFSDTDKLFKYIMSTGSNVPVILVSEDPKATLTTYPDIKVLGQMKMSDISNNLLPLVTGHFKELAKTSNSNEYCRIHTSLLLRVVPLGGDIYIRLSNVKFVKLFRSGAHFTKDDLEKYFVRRKVDYLYIKKEESKEFVHKFEEDLAVMALHAKPEDPQLLQTVLEVQDLIQQLSGRMGFNSEIISMAKSNVQLALKFIGSSPNIAKAISTSQLAGKNYISAHSVFLANLCCAISAQMDWPSESTFQKLVMASLFHDVVFQDVEHAKIGSMAELNLARYKVSEEEFNAIRNHSREAARIIRSLTEMPADVDTIILQHHERPDGSGYPEGLRSHQISPLAAVMIVAHDILDASLELKEAFTLKDFLFKMDPIYEGIAFRKVWRALANSEAELKSHSNAA